MIVQSKEMLTALAQHKQRREREMRKVETPPDEADVGFDEPEPVESPYARSFYHPFG